MSEGTYREDGILTKWLFDHETGLLELSDFDEETGKMIFNQAVGGQPAQLMLTVMMPF